MTGSEDFDGFVQAELAPDLRILRPLGRGSVASVYLANEAALDRLVAVKVLRPKGGRDETVRRRFEREARAAARIGHPNVTAVHRVGRLTDGSPYLVMEHVDGKNLEDTLASRGRISPAEGREVIRQLAAALAAAHVEGIIHRDLKPANILRETETGRVVLTDFGLAAARDRRDETTRLTIQGQVLGDLEYVAPEHLMGEEVTEAADLYALGVVAYHVLAGRGPYDARTPAEITRAHLNDQPVPLDSLRPDVGPRLAAAIARCLAKRPQQRPSAAVVVAELDPDGPADGAGRGAGRPDAAQDAGAFGSFLGELRRRHVYKVGATYLAIAIALIGLTEGVQEPLDLSDGAYRAIIGVVLAGFPVTLALSWMFDLRAGRIERTQDAEGSGVFRDRVLPLIGLALSLVAAWLIWGWVVLRGS